MKTLPVLVAAAAIAAGAQGLTAQQRITLTPTAFETFAALPDAKVTWSKDIGRLDGGTGSAIVSAVTLTSPASTPSTMRGIRIEMRHEGTRQSCDLKYVEWSVLCGREPALVFVDEDRLEGLRTAVLSGRAEVHPGHPMGITTYRSGSSGAGVLMFGFEISGRTLTEVADLVSLTAAALKTAPR